jgi:hypothetical protein
MFLIRASSRLLRMNFLIRRKIYIYFFSSLFILIFLPIVDSFAQGNLLLTPRRILFEGSKRSIDLNLANIGQDTATFAISMIQLRMNEKGSFEQITVPDEGQQFADKNLRYFPRIVTLPPNDAQVVKVQVIRKNQLAPGEYRSHFYFRSIPKVTPLDLEKVEIDTTEIAVRLTPVFGITIPAIIRIGESNTEIGMSVTSLEFIHEIGPTLKLRFTRTGDYSVYGDLIVNHISPQGEVTLVGRANGIAVYTPNQARNFQFELNNRNNVDFRTGKLNIVFAASSDLNKDLAEAEYVLH